MSFHHHCDTPSNGKPGTKYVCRLCEREWTRLDGGVWTSETTQGGRITAAIITFPDGRTKTVPVEIDR